MIKTVETIKRIKEEKVRTRVNIEEGNKRKNFYEM